VTLVAYDFYLARLEVEAIRNSRGTPKGRLRPLDASEMVRPFVAVKEGERDLI
jgi:hypothetical protein